MHALTPIRIRTNIHAKDKQECTFCTFKWICVWLQYEYEKVNSYSPLNTAASRGKFIPNIFSPLVSFRFLIVTLAAAAAAAAARCHGLPPYLHL